MNSSTPRFRFLASLAAVLVIPFAALVLSHAGLEGVSRWAEAKPGYYLWRIQDQLLLLTPTKFARPGRDRVMIFGASESAEGFNDRVIERNLPGKTVDNLAFDGSTFNDLLIQLQYLDAMYGAEAVPRDIVVGLSHRYLANIKIPKTKLFRDAVNQYSPAAVGYVNSEPRVTRKPRLRAVASWLRFRLHQTERYQYGLEAVGIELAAHVNPGWAKRHDVRSWLYKAKFQSRIRGTDEEIQKRLAGIPHWQATHEWMASEHRGLVERQLGAVNDFASRRHARVSYINMPVLPANRAMYAPGSYEDYLAVVTRTLGQSRMLDVGTLLATNEFSDAVHATAEGAAHLSRATAEFLKDDRN